ncbi:MAG: hypothetical protein R2772_07275 [Chitinophagales bacterium]
MRKLKSYLLLAICLAIFSNALAQQNTTPFQFWNSELQAIAKPESREGWIFFKDDFSTSPTSIFTTHKNAFNLGPDDEMILTKTKTDNLGWTHYFFQQEYKGINVDGAEYIIHSSLNETKANGSLALNINASEIPTIDDSIALSIAAVDFGSTIEYIESSDLRFIKYNSNSYILVHHFTLYGKVDAKEYYVNATNGNIEASFSLQDTYETEHVDIYTTGCRADYTSLIDSTFDTTFLGFGIVIDTILRYALNDSTRGNGIESFDHTKIV